MQKWQLLIMKCEHAGQRFVFVKGYVSHGYTFNTPGRDS